MQAVGECGGGWLVDETQNFEASDLAGIFGGLALGIIEIRGDGDNSAVDRFRRNKFSAQFFSSRRMKRKSPAAVNSFSPSITRMTFLLDGSMRNGNSFSSILNIGRTPAHEALHGIDRALGLRE